MDFLLECVGFPPDYDHDELVGLLASLGEPAPFRDRGGRELRLCGGPDGPTEVWPHFQGAGALRIEVDRVDRVPDSPFDAQLLGWVNPPGRGVPVAGSRYPFTTWLVDRRRLPRDVRRGRVLAVSVTGFAIDLRTPDGASSAPFVEPIGSSDDPGGCVELELPVLEVHCHQNPLTGERATRLQLDAPGRALTVFTSPACLDEAGLVTHSVGDRVRGTFLFSGTVAGGLPSATRRLGKSFG